ncbi:MAG: thioredoxin domain-containing protein [bacterium]
MEQNQNSSSNFSKNFGPVPAAIVIAAVIIACSIIYVKKPAAPSAIVATNNAGQQTVLKQVTSADHILGNPNAPIKIVMFSDPSCPYCKVFYTTMTQIMKQYGAGGQVAWVYRAFPLDKPNPYGSVLHKNAGHESQALECAATVGGNDKFWAYANRLYSVTPSVTPTTPGGLDQAQLPIIAQFASLDVTKFNNCLSSGQDAAAVEAQYVDGINAGVSGTPSSFIITPSGTMIPIQGAESYGQLKSIIDTLIDGTATAAAAQ